MCRIVTLTIFTRLWTQCQRCQGSLHEEVLCTRLVYLIPIIINFLYLLLVNGPFLSFLPLFLLPLFILSPFLFTHCFRLPFLPPFLILSFLPFFHAFFRSDRPHFFLSPLFLSPNLHALTLSVLPIFLPLFFYPAFPFFLPSFYPQTCGWMYLPIFCTSFF